MKWLTNGLVAGAAVLLIVACAERVSAPDSVAPDYTALVQRTMDLRERVVKSKKMTAAQRAELDQLSEDILAYQSRTGHTDISVTQSHPVQVRVDARLAVKGGGSNQDECQCPAVKAENGLICFLVQSGCTSNPILPVTVCNYSCIKIGPPTK